MSVASAGVKLAERIFGKLNERRALVLGAGTISEQVVSQLRDRGIAQLHVMNRSRDRADELAKQFSGKVVAGVSGVRRCNHRMWSCRRLARMNRFCGAISSSGPCSARKSRIVTDGPGVPRNIDPSVAELYNVYVYNTDDLSEIVQQNRNARESEVPRAQGIVDEHVTKFLSWQASVELVGLLMHCA